MIVIILLSLNHLSQEGTFWNFKIQANLSLHIISRECLTPVLVQYQLNQRIMKQEFQLLLK